MKLIAYGELRPLDGRPPFLYLRFQHEDGRVLDLPVAEEQFAKLAEWLTEPIAPATVLSPQGAEPTEDIPLEPPSIRLAAPVSEMDEEVL
jgi:hypothetical protein